MQKGSKRNVGRLHVIINSGDGSRPIHTPINLARQAIAGGADTLQYRNKGWAIRPMIEEAVVIRQLCRQNDVPFIVNDRLDLCLAVDADGIHLGREDMPLAMARRILGNSKLIGATVRDLVQLQQAEHDSADYVGLGPIFSTSSKTLPISPLGLDHLRKVTAHANIPVIAIAGITEKNCSDVMAAGADGVAVIGAVASASNPTEAVRTLFRLCSGEKGELPVGH